MVVDGRREVEERRDAVCGCQHTFLKCATWGDTGRKFLLAHFTYVSIVIRLLLQKSAWRPSHQDHHTSHSTAHAAYSRPDWTSLGAFEYRQQPSTAAIKGRPYDYDGHQPPSGPTSPPSHPALQQQRLSTSTHHLSHHFATIQLIPITHKSHGSRSLQIPDLSSNLLLPQTSSRQIQITLRVQTPTRDSRLWSFWNIISSSKWNNQGAIKLLVAKINQRLLLIQWW
jgi:hypothetical protein